MKVKAVTAFAPATVANVAVGFDILGFALQGLGEKVSLEKILKAEVQIEKIVGHPEIPLDPTKNTAGKALLQLIQDKKLKFGFKVRIEKQIPMGSGLGGSATSAVAAVVAANALLSQKLKPEELLKYALIGEEVASGSKHADNVAPCLLGGLNFVQSATGDRPLQAFRIKTPRDLMCVILLPKTTINTKDARKLLAENVSLKTAVQQTSNLAGFILGCTSNNYPLIEASLSDVMIEPQRAPLIPGFYTFKKAALVAGALGCSISGSGPAIFCLVRGQAGAEKVLRRLKKVAKTEKIDLHSAWISGISSQGTRVVKAKK